MRKVIRILLFVFAGLVVIVLLAGFFGWRYVNKQFLGFEEVYAAATDLRELTVDGYTFVDRNGNGALDPYEDDRLSAEARVTDLLDRMTVEEKIHLLKGSGLASAIGWVEPGEGIPGVVGTIVATPRLGLPAINLSDGPAGLRIEPRREGEDRTYYATAFPIASQVAATWNTELARDVGEAMGAEAQEYGIDVILGPGANIHRHPLTGRNFEYFSEDPVLTGRIGAAIVNGIESNGVGTSVKHFVANNQETKRNFNDARISERALREIYLRGFEIIVKEAQPWTVMSSYNKVNGTYVAESPRLLTDVLRDDWGFGGVVMSDWFGGNDAPAMIRAGNDLLEPGTRQQWDALIEAHAAGGLPEQAIDTAAARILRLVLKSHKMNGYRYGEDPDLRAHAAVARRAAAEGVVLLKNDGPLPLSSTTNVALLGVTSYDLISGGTGSGDVNEAYSVSLAQGLQSAGFTINETARSAYARHREAHAEAFDKPEGFRAMFEPYDPPEVDYSDVQLQEFARTADVAVLTIGRNSGEGGDRRETDDFLLRAEERALLERTCEAFHAAGKPVVVVLNVGGVIETASWRDLPDALLLAWQGGQEGGNAAADILGGAVSPSGRLPMTWPLRLSDHASHANFPPGGGTMNPLSLIWPQGEMPEAEQERNVDYTDYEEGIYVGYRHFDRAGLDVAYPFGYGLSYTEFTYGEPSVTITEDTLRVSLTVTNTGIQAGKEVVQLYVGQPEARIDRPDRELKAFAKTDVLSPQESAALTLSVPVDDLSYWDEAGEQWRLEPGTYTIDLGTSSRDIRVSAPAQW